mmetsp:Transcript_105200/g.296234  ORF Transcript_105200/g.296234 Transcript_105200/m.296234 type:complete len:307 (+) Transcript_105200:321-1241(+)
MGLARLHLLDVLGVRGCIHTADIDHRVLVLGVGHVWIDRDVAAACHLLKRVRCEVENVQQRGTDGLLRAARQDAVAAVRDTQVYHRLILVREVDLEGQRIAFERGVQVVRHSFGLLPLRAEGRLHMRVGEVLRVLARDVDVRQVGAAEDSQFKDSFGDLLNRALPFPEVETEMGDKRHHGEHPQTTDDDQGLLRKSAILVLHLLELLHDSVPGRTLLTVVQAITILVGPAQQFAYLRCEEVFLVDDAAHHPPLQCPYPLSHEPGLLVKLLLVRGVGIPDAATSRHEGHDDGGDHPCHRRHDGRSVK